MAAADSLIGEGLAPSPYAEAMAENEELRRLLRETLLPLSHVNFWHIWGQRTLYERIEDKVGAL